MITDTTDNTENLVYAVSLDGPNATGHCVLYYGSEVYDDDIEDPKSIAYIMDPSELNLTTIPITDFIDKYTRYYIKN